MFTLTRTVDANNIIIGGGFYYFAQIVYISLIIAVCFTILNFVVNAIFFKKNRNALVNLKGVRKIKILNLISLVLFPISIIGMIVVISLL